MNSCVPRVEENSLPPNPLTALLETFFPGFSLLSSTIYKYAKIDLSIYIPTILAVAGLAFASRYAADYLWQQIRIHFMSTADIRTDDEMYNMFMAWVSQQKFAKSSRNFVANVNLNTRNWFVWFETRDFNGDDANGDDELDSEDDSLDEVPRRKRREKPLNYTPSFGKHYFWFKGHILIFERNRVNRQHSPDNEREEISISSFGRNPKVLKELLLECRDRLTKNDENKTLIYRGRTKPGTVEVAWTRCMSRISRPFSTVVLDETIKKDILADMREYLHPRTRRWYSNRGIPYRRGYLLYGPPGTGKSSLSFAIAGYFNLKIYIVSLNSPTMNEENLGTLFAELPTACVVLLEDIDNAGLTHTRDTPPEPIEVPKTVTAIPAGATPGVPTNNSNMGRISLSALLNILDGVASQEGRILLMTTNHIEKLDSALIRPGRVDMKIRFKLATTDMIKTIFRTIFTTSEGDQSPKVMKRKQNKDSLAYNIEPIDTDDKRKMDLEIEKENEKICELAEAFSHKIPADTFSLAEIQGYLLKYKRYPQNALADAADWAEQKLREKLKKSEKDNAMKEKKSDAKKVAAGTENAKDQKAVCEDVGSAGENESPSSGQRSELSTPSTEEDS